MRANLSLLERHRTPEAHLDTEAREQESGIVRREQANHLLPQHLRRAVASNEPALPVADNQVNTTGGPLAVGSDQDEFRGEFWDTAPLGADGDLEFDSAAQAEAPPAVSYSQPRRIGGILAFAIVFSVTVLLLLGEVALWVLKRF